MAFYRRKQSSVTIRHVSGDEVIAMIEIVSPGNKSGRKAVSEFVDKACMLLKNDIHLLVLDVLPPGSADPQGMHGEIWETLEGVLPDDLGKPFVFSSYEADIGVRAFAEAADLGDSLPQMPLFLVPRKHVLVPLEKTYESAFAALPRRRRDVVAAEWNVAASFPTCRLVRSRIVMLGHHESASRENLPPPSPTGRTCLVFATSSLTRSLAFAIMKLPSLTPIASRSPVHEVQSSRFPLELRESRGRGG